MSEASHLMTPELQQQIIEARLIALDAAINDLLMEIQYIKGCLQYHGLSIAIDEDKNA